MDAPAFISWVLGLQECDSLGVWFLISQGTMRERGRERHVYRYGSTHRLYYLLEHLVISKPQVSQVSPVSGPETWRKTVQRQRET